MVVPLEMIKVAIAIEYERGEAKAHAEERQGHHDGGQADAWLTGHVNSPNWLFPARSFEDGGPESWLFSRWPWLSIRISVRNAE